LQSGYLALNKRGAMSRTTLFEIQEIIEQNQAGFRKLPGTALLNNRTSDVVYVPPEPQYIDEKVSLAHDSLL
jgi:hypothetical protein